jgi:hypothetical protein
MLVEPVGERVYHSNEEDQAATAEQVDQHFGGAPGPVFQEPEAEEFEAEGKALRPALVEEPTVAAAVVVAFVAALMLSRAQVTEISQQVVFVQVEAACTAFPT